MHEAFSLYQSSHDDGRLQFNERLYGHHCLRTKIGAVRLSARRHRFQAVQAAYIGSFIAFGPGGWGLGFRVDWGFKGVDLVQGLGV